MSKLNVDKLVRKVNDYLSTDEGKKVFQSYRESAASDDAALICVINHVIRVMRYESLIMLLDRMKEERELKFNKEESRLSREFWGKVREGIKRIESDK